MSRKRSRPETPFAGPPAAARPRTPFPWLLLAAVFAAWWFGAGGLLRHSHWAHYTYLADAFLNGQLHLFRSPNDAGDMAFDAGYHYILMGEEFEKRVAQYGRFSLHFLPANLWGWLARPPLWQDGRLVPDPHGMSLLLTTPYLLLALWPRRVTRLEWVAAGTFALASLPSLLYYNDGWVQFGQRFALDGVVPALVVASFGAARAPRALVVALALWGAAVGAWGLQWFQRSFLH